MRVGDSTAGVLTLVRPPDKPAFNLSDLRVLEDIGEHLALALRTERRDRRRSDTAAALQASLLPQVPAPMPGLDWAAAYRPGTQDIEVGGDFYDFFKSPGGWGLVLGDVCGKGEEAAAVAAMVRHGIRLLSLWDDHPAQVLAKVNAAMMARHETDRFVTAAAAHLRWRADRLDVKLTSAGHPAAALVRASGEVSFASGGGLPLGMFEDADTRTERLALRAGDTLVLYSDGVTDRRAADGSFYGTARLAEALTGSLGRPAVSIVKTIEDDLSALQPGCTVPRRHGRRRGPRRRPARLSPDPRRRPARLSHPGLGVADVPEQVTQRRLEPRVAERLAAREQGVRADPLAGFGQFARAFLAEQQPRPEARDRNDRRPP